MYKFHLHGTHAYISFTLTYMCIFHLHSTHVDISFLHDTHAYISST